MTKKPEITHSTQLAHWYARYRRALCARDAVLQRRLRQGRAVSARFGELVAQFDGILLDAYGVLNRGDQAISGAPAAVSRLRESGIPFLVVSNNASQSPAGLVRGFLEMGFHSIGQQQVLTSGMAVTPFIARSPYCGRPYFLVGTPDSGLAYAPDAESLMVNHPRSGRNLEDAAFILICSNRDYYGRRQEREAVQLLSQSQRPLLLANPDLVAPDSQGGFYAVAGYTAMALADCFQAPIIGIGKPFAPFFNWPGSGFPELHRSASSWWAIPWRPISWAERP